MLYIHWNINPEIFYSPGFDLRYYSIMFMLAFASSYYLLSRIFKKENIDAKLLNSLTVYVIAGTIIGARLGHCLFYEFDYYKSHLLEIVLPFTITNGQLDFTGYQGLASHGGALGILIAIWLYNRKYKTGILWVPDRLCIVIPLAGFFIRTGNFFNSEIIGKPSNMPWAVVFGRIDAIPRHPAMLYEALCYLIIFIILYRFYKIPFYRKRNGLLFGIFLVLVFSARFFIEFFKENQEAFEGRWVLNLGQLLSIPFMIAGLWLIIKKYQSGADESFPNKNPVL